MNDDHGQVYEIALMLILHLLLFRPNKAVLQYRRIALCPSVQVQTTGKRSHKNKNNMVMQIRSSHVDDVSASLFSCYSIGINSIPDIFCKFIRRRCGEPIPNPKHFSMFIQQQGVGEFGRIQGPHQSDPEKVSKMCLCFFGAICSAASRL
jgi:hypothetical protein